MKQSPKSYKVYLDSAQISCKPNAITIYQIVNYLQENQHKISKDPRDADFIIFNTCGYDQFHEEMSQKFIRDAANNKRADAKILVLGCMNKIRPSWLDGQKHGIQMVQKLEDLDGIFLTRKRLNSAKQACFTGSDAINRRIFEDVTWFGKVTMFCGDFLYKHFKDYRYPRFSRARFGKMLEEIRCYNKCFVQIGSGCVGNCSYCIIKKAKGSPKSRSTKDILDDLRCTYSKGKVINLVADDCPSFGVDTGTDLFQLLDEINRFFPNVPIDISYVNPVWLERHGEKFLDIFQRIKINSVNISMQSFSDKVIRLMNRKYQSQNVIEIIKKIRRISPETLVWGHMLTGFPGETWGDFYASFKQCKYFDYFYAFAYSPRSGTASMEMSNRNSSFSCEVRRQLLQYMQLIRIAGRVFL